ncbi:hypothetical protein D3C81_1517080 [compost metagenome]
MAVQAQGTKAARWLGRGDGGELAIRAVEVDQRADIDIADTVAIGEAERFFIIQILAHTLQAAPRHGFVTGIDQGNLPGLGIACVYFHLIVLHIESDIGGMQKIIGEIFLDHIALVAAANHEIIDAVR